jgi:alkaline phosphatase D
MYETLGRRKFLKDVGRSAIGVTALSVASPGLDARPKATAAFRSAWNKQESRVWPGPEYWSNPLQDWHVHDGKLECIVAGGDRNVVLLTREVSARSGDLKICVRMGKVDAPTSQVGFVGFRLGSKNGMSSDYRASAIYGRGLNVGVTANGLLFIGALETSAPKIDLTQTIDLECYAVPSANGYEMQLRARTPGSETTVETRREIPAEWLTGTLALVCSSVALESSPIPIAPVKDFSFYPRRQERGGTMRFWFSDWTVEGSKADVHEDRAFGPILFTLYTLSRGTMKLSAQFPPLGASAGLARLQIREADGTWRQVATAEIDRDACNATFRVTSWDMTRNHSYRVVYSMRDSSGGSKEYFYEGLIRKDPNEKKSVTIGLLTCTWDFGFPHNDFTKNLTSHKPDILLWTGDQVYEANGGFGFIDSRAPDMIETAMLDFLRKWMVWGWCMRELTRDIPSVCMTDDHDMYHGNIWGCGGRPVNPAAGNNFAVQDSGGYKMLPRWVNMVQRLQTAHLPNPFDPTPVEQGIGVYYTDLLCGGVSFAILEDRKWKSAPKQQLPGANIFNGFPLNREWSPATQSNVPTAELFGQRQLEFLEYWASNWSGRTWMKFAVSQTPLGCLHTEPGGVLTDHDDPEEAIPPVGRYVEGDHMVADHDSGAWPQHGRDQAIKKWSKGFAAHLCGDQHLGSTAHYGVDKFRDGVYSVCTPAISNIFPRRWFPPTTAPNAVPGTRNTGDYQDAFGNRMSVLAIANPAKHEGSGLDGLRFRVTGYTIVTCDRETRNVIVAAWPRWIDPSATNAKPYAGWPITFNQLDNGWWEAKWELAPISTNGFSDPVVQVRDATNGEIVYTLRIRGTSFVLLLRDPGTYNVLAYDPDGNFRVEWKGLEARRRKQNSPIANSPEQRP